MSSVLIDNQKISGGLIVTAGNNTSAWYTRVNSSEFTVNGSFNPLEGIFDWVLTKTTDTHYVKSNVIKFKNKKSTFQVVFKTPFIDDNYYVFFSSNSNVNLFWSSKKKNGFIINASSEFDSEITWIAIHKSFSQLTGVNNPGTIYSGSRNLIYDTIPCTELTLDCGNTDACVAKELDISQNCHANLHGWYENELIIRPSSILDSFTIPMLFSDTNYSILLSTNTNINTFWLYKSTDRAKIGTSYPINCIIDFLFIKNGIDWWDELP
jgi:hypothetical protein